MRSTSKLIPMMKCVKRHGQVTPSKISDECDVTTSAVIQQFTKNEKLIKRIVKGSGRSPSVYKLTNKGEKYLESINKEKYYIPKNLMLFHSLPSRLLFSKAL